MQCTALAELGRFCVAVRAPGLFGPGGRRIIGLHHACYQAAKCPVQSVPSVALSVKFSRPGRDVKFGNRRHSRGYGGIRGLFVVP
jgi:hypothetical protein